MAATMDIACPFCSKPLKVPSELAGKIIRCKDCGDMFEVPGAEPPPPKPAAARPVAAKPAAARPAAARPAAKPAAPVAAAPPAADAPIPFKDDPPAPPPPVDDDDNPNPYGLVHDDSDVPRCPFCAKELDPPDTKICLNCGYDLINRQRHDSKKVYSLSAMDWAAHLGPGIACALAVIFLLAFDAFVFMNMRGWLEGSLLDAQEKNKVTGEAIFYVPPFCFNLWLGVVSAWLMWMAGKFAVKRLVYNWMPEETLKK